MNNYKIHVPNEAESKEAQELFFELGYDWFLGTRQFSNCSSKLITAHSDGLLAGIEHDGCEYKELTLPKLRDLVVLNRNDVNDATHSCDGMNGAALNLSGSWYGYNYNEKKWQAWDEIEDDEYKISDLKPIQKHKLEQGLISGADALIAIGKGERVQYSFDDDKYWQNDIANLKIADFGGGHYEFRLKPRTIKLEIEVPAPFEPKVGEEYFYIQSCKNGYAKSRFNSKYCDQNLLSFGAWRTEADIKIVVEQLRKLKEYSK